MTDKKINRFVVLRFIDGWIVWDNQKARTIDGIYTLREDACAIALAANGGEAWLDRQWFEPPTHFPDQAE